MDDCTIGVAGLWPESLCLPWPSMASSTIVSDGVSMSTSAQGHNDAGAGLPLTDLSWKGRTGPQGVLDEGEEGEANDTDWPKALMDTYTPPDACDANQSVAGETFAQHAKPSHEALTSSSDQLRKQDSCSNFSVASQSGEPEIRNKATLNREHQKRFKQRQRVCDNCRQAPQGATHK